MEASRRLPPRKQNERRLPIKSISPDKRLTGFVLFCPELLSPPSSLCGGQCVSQHFFPDESNAICRSLRHSLSLSLPLDFLHHSSKWESGVTVMWWVYTDCQDGLLPWEMCRRTHTHRHTHNVTHKRQTQSHMRAFTHIHTHNRTHAWPYNRRRTARTHTRAVQWTPGPVSPRSLNLTVFQLETGPGRRHGSTASTATPNTLNLSNTQIQTHTNFSHELNTTWDASNVLMRKYRCSYIKNTHHLQTYDMMVTHDTCNRICHISKSVTNQILSYKLTFVLFEHTQTQTHTHTHTHTPVRDDHSEFQPSSASSPSWHIHATTETHTDTLPHTHTHRCLTPQDSMSGKDLRTHFRLGWAMERPRGPLGCWSLPTLRLPLLLHQAADKVSQTEMNPYSAGTAAWKTQSLFFLYLWTNRCRSVRQSDPEVVTSLAAALHLMDT